MKPSFSSNFFLIVISCIVVLRFTIESSALSRHQTLDEARLPFRKEEHHVRDSSALANNQSGSLTSGTKERTVATSGPNGFLYSSDSEARLPVIETIAYVTQRLREIPNSPATSESHESFLPPSPEKHAVFYNVFVPEVNEQGVFRLVIGTQMRAVQASPYRDAPVYYNLIGVNSSLPVCRQGQTCRRLRYLKTGGEVDTLQDMYEYCTERPDEIVLYLHDKGSFHFTPSNSRIRRIATRAAVTPECYNMTHCDVCAQNFNFAHYHHISGNMFSARCSYIRNLIPPKEFETRRLRMIQDLINNKTLLGSFSCFQECVLNGKHNVIQSAKLLAIGRYSVEAWIASSPTLEPCYVVTTPFEELLNGWEYFEPNLTMGHQFQIPKLFGLDKLSYYQGPGKIFEYKHLYGREPANESWFWQVWSRYLDRHSIICEC